jgi:type IV pilus assembly protein PilV
MEPTLPDLKKPGRLQGGATLLEAMIGILIFSLGILALVGMQALAIKQVNDAKYRADASFFANQIIGEMWVNRTNLANYAYAGGGGPPAALANWVTSVQNGLPGVTGAVNQPTVTVAGTTVTVTVFWQPPAATAAHRHVTIAYING